MTSKELTAGRPSIVEAGAAVGNFLRESLPEVHKVSVTKLVPLDSGEAVWEAEAVVWQPNPTIEALGLHTERPILDQEVYVVRLDGHLDVVGYEIKVAE